MSTQKDTHEHDIELSTEELETNGTASNAAVGDEDVIIDEDAELDTTQVVKKLREKLKIAVEEKQHYLDGWQRDKAEFLNARKRDEESKQEFFKFAKQQLVEDLLPVLDSFDMAMSNKTSWESVSEEWRKGIEGIYNQYKNILFKNEVVAFGAIGDVFDPNLHQSIGVLETSEASKDNTVGEVLQKGYSLSGRVVRPAFVKVLQKN